MSTGMPTTTNPPQSKSDKLQTAWIGWLNNESNTDSRKSTIAQDFKSKRKVDTQEDLIFKDTNSLRAAKIKQDINTEKQRYELVKSLLATTSQQEIDLAVTNAEDAITSDLSIPVNNDLALKNVSILSRKINEACQSLKPGLGSLVKEMVTLESSAAYKAACECDPEVKKQFDRLKTSAQQPQSQVTQLAQSIQELKVVCHDLTLGQKATKEKIDETAKEQKKLEEKIGKLDVEVFNACKLFLNRATEIIKAASALKVSAVTKIAIDDHTREVDALLIAAKAEQKSANEFLDKYSNADESKRKTLAELSQVQHKIQSLKNGAEKAGYTGNIDDILLLDALSQTFKNADIEDAKKVLSEMETAILKKRQEWENAKAGCHSLIRFADQVLAGSMLSDDEFVMGIDSRSEAATKLRALAEDARQVYDDAVENAKILEYDVAVNALVGAKDRGKAFAKLIEAQEETGELLRTEKVDDTELEGRKQAFNTSIGDITNKSHIRFDSDAMAMMMLSGIELDSDEKDIVYSQQFKLMQKHLDVGLEKWHKLVDAGCDPFKAAERAFEGIPENFWPPQAVRVIAMFRKAEAEFAGEREAAELTEGLQASSVKKVVDVTLEIAQHAGERTADAFAGMLAWYKKTHELELKGLSDKVIKQKAEAYFKEHNHIDFKTATEVVGGLAAGLGALNGAYKVGKESKDIHEARQKIEAYNPETDSPVSLKIAEFERNRAVWHLLSAQADMIISALGPATDAVPALGLLGDAKTLIISVGEAAVYFSRLRDAKATEKTAKTDPESLAELALANEAHKLGLLSAQKTFDAATAILKILGQGLDMGGVTAVAGFGVKAGTTVLMYCGKALFALIKWNDRRNAVKALSDARADPTNIELVEFVFERCTMYSRFLLADGALNGDAWCRQYILSRGVTDRDLDNPNTSTAVIREYLNVTFQPKSGDAEEDDDLGTTEREQKEKKLLPSEEQDFSTWSRAKIELTSADFQAAYDEACKSGGLKADKQQKKFFSGLLDEYTKAFTQANDDKTKSENALQNAKNSPQELELAEKALTTAINSTAHLANVVTDCRREFVTAVPQATTKDTKGKFKIHSGFQIYMGAIVNAMNLAFTPFEDFRNGSSEQLMSLKFGHDVGSEDLITSAREEFEKLAIDQQKILKRQVDTVKNAINKAWDTIPLKTKSAKDGVLAKLIKKIEKSTEMTSDFITNGDDKLTVKGVKDRFAAIKETVLKSAGGMCFKLVTEEQVLNEKADKIQDPQAKAKELKKIEAKINKKIETDIISFSLDKAAVLLAGEFDDAINELYEKSRQDDQKLTVADIELTRKFWRDCKVELAKHGWEFVGTGIGEQLDAFQLAETNWKLLPKDEELQSGYNAAYGKLLNSVSNLPILRKDGVAVPGMKKFKKDFVAKLKENKASFDKIIKEPSGFDPKAQGNGGWSIPKTQFDTWPISRDGWNLIHHLAEKHSGGKPHKSRKPISNFFRKLDEAIKDYKASTDQNERTLIKTRAELCKSELDTQLKAFEKKVPIDPSIVNYVQNVQGRLTTWLADELK